MTGTSASVITPLPGSWRGKPRNTSSAVNDLRRNLQKTVSSVLNNRDTKAYLAGNTNFFSLSNSR